MDPENDDTKEIGDEDEFRHVSWLAHALSQFIGIDCSNKNIIYYTSAVDSFANKSV